MEKYYFVMVNNKIMVRVHAESAPAAAGVVINLFAPEDSQFRVEPEVRIYSREEMKSDSFYDDFCSCEFMSIWQLEKMIGDYFDTAQDIADADNIICGLTKKIMTLEKKRDDMRDRRGASSNQFKRQAEDLGMVVEG